MHEASLYKRNSFVTLTYDDKHLPHRGQLHYPDFQKFMKRLRKHTGLERVRFYMGGEYGEETKRPHYHACIFGHDWQDKLYFKRTGSGEAIYTSQDLQKLWPMGHSSIGKLTFESAAYIARYCVSKVTGEAAKEHYKRHDQEGEYHLIPEFNKMSLKPGIGARWLELYEGDVYNFGSVVVRGVECQPPKYYDKLFKRKNPGRMEEITNERIQGAMERAHDNTPARLAVKETVARARTKQLVRGL